MNATETSRLSEAPRNRLAATVLWLLASSVVLSGCAVVGVAGLAVDAAVGTAKIGGKVIGKTADVVLGSDAAPAD